MVGRLFLPAFGQLVVSSMVGGQVSALPKAGVHQLTTCPQPECTFVGPPAPLGVLRPGQALVWPMTSPRARVVPADRLYILQTPDPVAACPDGALTEQALAWLEALDRQSRVEGAVG